MKYLGLDAGLVTGVGCDVVSCRNDNIGWMSGFYLTRLLARLYQCIQLNLTGHLALDPVSGNEAGNLRPFFTSSLSEMLTDQVIIMTKLSHIPELHTTYWLRRINR